MSKQQVRGRIPSEISGAVMARVTQTRKDIEKHISRYSRELGVSLATITSKERELRTSMQSYKDRMQNISELRVTCVDNQHFGADQEIREILNRKSDSKYSPKIRIGNNRSVRSNDSLFKLPNVNTTGERRKTLRQIDKLIHDREVYPYPWTRKQIHVDSEETLNGNTINPETKRVHNKLTLPEIKSVGKTAFHAHASKTDTSDIYDVIEQNKKHKLSQRKKKNKTKSTRTNFDNLDGNNPTIKTNEYEEICPRLQPNCRKNINVFASQYYRLEQDCKQLIHDLLSLDSVEQSIDNSNDCTSKNSNGSNIEAAQQKRNKKPTGTKRMKLHQSALDSIPECNSVDSKQSDRRYVKSGSYPSEYIIDIKNVQKDRLYPLDKIPEDPPVNYYELYARISRKQQHFGAETSLKQKNVKNVKNGQDSGCKSEQIDMKKTFLRSGLEKEAKRIRAEKLIRLKLLSHSTDRDLHITG